MITPNDIANKRFEKAMGGYRQDDVDRYLEEAASAFSTALEQNKEMERKLEVLAEKLQQYREDEDSLRSALIGAQKLGDSVIREAKTKAEYIIHDATSKADRILETAKKDIEKEKDALVKIQKEVTAFKNRLLSLYKQHLEIISNLPEADSPKREEKAPTPMPQAAPEPVMEEVTPPAAAVEEEEQTAFEAQTITYQIDIGSEEEDSDDENVIEFVSAVPASADHESKFGDLKFGEGYDVTRNDENGGQQGRFSRKKFR